MRENFSIPSPTDDRDRKLLADIERVGWHVLQITADEPGPQYSFTVGLYHTFGHPEIIVMGLAPKLAHQVINLAVVNILGGESFPVGLKTDLLLENFVVRLGR